MRYRDEIRAILADLNLSKLQIRLRTSGLYVRLGGPVCDVEEAKRRLLDAGFSVRKTSGSHGYFESDITWVLG